MTENKLADMEKDKKNEVEVEKKQEKDKSQGSTLATQKERSSKAEQHESRFRRLSQFLDLLNIPRYHSGSSSSSNNSQQHSPQTPHAASEIIPVERRSSSSSCNNNNIAHDGGTTEQDQQQQQQQQQQQILHQGSSKRSSCISFSTEILLFDLINGEINDVNERSQDHTNVNGTQRVYKKHSPNSILTMYSPTREIILSADKSSALKGIVYADPKTIQGYRIYAQLVLTFRYGREDEEVMGLRFSNEIVMSLHQIWPRKEESNSPALSPLQEALLKHLGDGAHPFNLTLPLQAPPSVQLVPAKCYHGAPIGTSYDVRCFIGNKTDEKFVRRASVKMRVRVIYVTDVFKQGQNGAGNFTALTNNKAPSPPAPTITSPTAGTLAATSSALAAQNDDCQQASKIATDIVNCDDERQAANKPRKSDRADSFSRSRLSPKSFRFSGRFSRSKSEVDKCSGDALFNYRKSFQEYDSVACGGPRGAVEKPFLLQDGRISLRASLNKSWYTHGEDVCVTINIRNESKKSVRKIRVSAIQHVDVCMFNNGKFKNVVADSDSVITPGGNQHVAPGATLNTTFILKPQKGATKNWIALEDTLQGISEPHEINVNIAASAFRTPHFNIQANLSPSSCTSPVVSKPDTALPVAGTAAANAISEERNVFAIYVSYYVKVKLTVSSMGGELSLKLPFTLVHIDKKQRQLYEMHKLNFQAVPINKKNSLKIINYKNKVELSNNLDRIESVDEGNLSRQASPLHVKDHSKAPQPALMESNEDSHLRASSEDGRSHTFNRRGMEEDLTIEDENEQEGNIAAQIHNPNDERNSATFGPANIEQPIFQKLIKKNSKIWGEDV